MSVSSRGRGALGAGHEHQPSVIRNETLGVSVAVVVERKLPACLRHAASSAYIGATGSHVSPPAYLWVTCPASPSA
jgi:hypothetical protein